MWLDCRQLKNKYRVLKKNILVNLVSFFIESREKLKRMIMVQSPCYTNDSIKAFLCVHISSTSIILAVLFVSPSKIALQKLYVYCPPPPHPQLLDEIYAHAGIGIGTTLLSSMCVTTSVSDRCMAIEF